MEPTPAGTQPLDPGLAALARGRAESEAAGMPETSVADNRARIVSGHRLCSAGPEVDRVEEVVVPGHGEQPDVPVRVYSPAGEATGTFLYAHGGGWFTGDLDYGDEFCRFLVADAGLRVVSVDYRLAPEHPFPAPLDDVSAALAWVAATYPGMLGVVGDSAGGNLVAAALLRARTQGPRVDVQVLVYPVTDSDFTRESYVSCNDAFPLGRADLEHCFEQYVPDVAVRSSVEVSPVRADLTGMPPAVVVVVGHDPLHDEGVAHAEALRAAGVPATLVDHPNLCHGFLRFTGASDASVAARDALVRLTAQVSRTHTPELPPIS